MGKIDDAHSGQAATDVAARAPGAFTPGPWEVHSGDNYYIFATDYPATFLNHFKDDDSGHALAYIGNRPMDFGRANADLIAAAPKLLAACEAADEAINPPDKRGISLHEWDKRLKAATMVIRAAIATALGARE